MQELRETLRHDLRSSRSLIYGPWLAAFAVTIIAGTTGYGFLALLACAAGLYFYFVQRTPIAPESRVIGVVVMLILAFTGGIFGLILTFAWLFSPRFI